MRNGILVSIVIPVYNAEKFLCNTIEQVMKQTNDNFELILIDDGSKDNSWKICQEYAQKDSRIRAYHQENKGESGARNAGLTKAKGKYICLCDNDDFFTPERVEVISHYAELFNPDVIRGRLCIHRGDKIDKDHMNHPYEELLNKAYIKNEIVPYLIGIKKDENKKVNSHNTLCFKRELYEKYNLKYNEKLKKENDHRFLVDVISCADSIVFTEKFEFHWVIRKGSHSSSYSPRFQNICDNFRHYQQLWEGQYDFNSIDKIQYNCHALIECLEYVIIHKKDCDMKKELHSILDSDESKDWFSKLEPYDEVSSKLKQYVTKEQYDMAANYITVAFVKKRFGNLKRKIKRKLKLK